VAQICPPLGVWARALGPVSKALTVKSLNHFILVSLLGVTLPAFAAGDDEKDTDHPILEMNDEISRKIDDIAKSLDVYLADKEYVDEENRTRIVLRNNFHWTEGATFSYKPHISVRLHLPNLQRKWQLRITSYDEDEEERGINKNRFQTEEQEEEYGTSFALFQDLGKVRTEFRPRLEITDSVETSYLLKFSSDADILWFSINPELQLFARSDDGTGQFAAINFDFQVTSSNMLTLINEEQYTDGDNTFSTNNGLKWTHLYNERMSQEYAVIFESNNRATYHLSKWTFSPSFRHKLFKNVTHYSLTPYLTFEEENEFHGRAGVKLNVDFIF